VFHHQKIILKIIKKLFSIISPHNIVSSVSQDYETVAMVDDEKDNVSLFIELLQTNGYAVIGFTNPLLLIDFIHEHPDQFRLILIDYRMPKMTGCQLANQIHAIIPKIKMILLTAF